MTIRQITAIDALQYYELRTRSEQEYPEFVGFNAERELDAGPEGIAALLEGYPAEGSLILGAFEGMELLAVVALSRRLSTKYRHKAFLWGMYVLPEQRGQGLAQQLMQETIDWARGHSQVIALSLQVTLTNQRAYEFYKRAGFYVTGTEQNALFAGDRYHDVHCMELSLGSL